MPITEATFTTRPALRLEQRPRERLDREERALQVDVEDGVPVGFGHAHQQPVARDARVVHEDVDAAVGLLDRVGERRHVGRGAHVAAVRVRLAAALAHGRGGRFGVLFFRRDAGDGRAGAPQRFGDGAARCRATPR
jgi:hypothetical protein